VHKQPGSSVFAIPNFRLLFGGSLISAIGDQFTLVALPWLVLKLTGDPAALGLVLAAMALPRAVFMLIGGAVVDRAPSTRCWSRCWRRWSCSVRSSCG
jgi:MFS family permease